ncbi:hypothetical protein IJI94_03255 [Candidatus Saccharibacteria bacterium]|nr:hypothetical protein [Candidatus Saccharibacteria bacterium]
MLVLAIAGLIFLMVFIALPALQRSQRDTQRRDDMSRFMSQIAQFSANNNGKIPENADVGSSSKTFEKNYMKQTGNVSTSEWVDPSGQEYIIKYEKITSDKTISGSFDGKTVYYETQAKCGNGDGKVQKTGKARDYAVLFILEGSGIYCGDNS